MAWGKSAATGVGDLTKRLADNDAGLLSLTILRFRRFDDEDAEQLSAALAVNTVLKEFICCSHAISRRAATKLGAGLGQNSCLQRLGIGNSSFGDQALISLVEGGLLQNKGLLYWDLEHKGLTHECAASVAQVLQQHPRLQHIVLSRNKLCDIGVHQLCGCSWSTNLTRLCLSDCGITHQGISALAAAPSLSQIQQLDLSHNNLNAAAAAALQQLLENARQLQSLNLQGTSIGDEGVKGVAEGLTAAAELRQLNLSSAGVGSSGLAAIAEALETAKAGLKLQELLLGGNAAVDDAAVCRLASSLQAVQSSAVGQAGGDSGPQQQQLTLDVSGTGIGANGINALSRLLGLKKLSLFGCKLGSMPGDACAALKESISTGGYAGVLELNLTGCELHLQQLKALISVLYDKSLMPELLTLELGANPGLQEDGFEQAVGQLRVARSELDVHWRMADSDHQQ